MKGNLKEKKKKEEVIKGYCFLILQTGKTAPHG